MEGTEGETVEGTAGGTSNGTVEGTNGGGVGGTAGGPVGGTAGEAVGGFNIVVQTLALIINFTSTLIIVLKLEDNMAAATDRND